MGTGVLSRCSEIQEQYRTSTFHGNKENNRRENLGLPDSSVGKESAYNAGDLSSIPGLGRSAGEEIGYPLQYSGLENSTDGGVAKSQT